MTWASHLDPGCSRRALSAWKFRTSANQTHEYANTQTDANKGRVVTRLSELLGIPPAQVAAIGDMPNDVPMFRAAALGIAMGHASDDVKRCAAFVTTSSEDEGFARAVEQHILGQ